MFHTPTLDYNPVYTPASLDVDMPADLVNMGLPQRMKLFARYGSDTTFVEYHVTTLGKIIQHYPMLSRYVFNEDENRDFHIVIVAVNKDYEYKIENIGCRLDERFKDGCMMRYVYSKYPDDVTVDEIFAELSHARFVDNPETLYYISVLYNQPKGILGWDGRAQTLYHAHYGKVVDGFTRVYALTDQRYKRSV